MAAGSSKRPAPDDGEQQERGEHLGWRASGAPAVKRRKNIEGVSAKGVVELQAQLYAAQEAARLRADGGAGLQDKHLRRKAGIDVASIRNRGVEEREARDKALTLKSRGHGDERLAEASASLQRKAALYDRLAARGGGGDDEEDDKYEVEFWRKGRSHQEEADEQRQRQQRHEQDWLQQQREGGWGPDTAAAAVGGSGDMMTEDMAREAERRAWEAEELERLAAEAQADEQRAARRAAVHELSGQTQIGREEAAAAKAAKQEQLAAKRSRLKAAFISQQLSAIKAAKQAKPAAAAGKGGSGAGSSKAGQQQR